MITLHDKTYTCPVDAALGLIGGKWKILILFDLYISSRKGYSEIKSNLPGISEKMLSQQLRELELDKLISKTVLTEKPYRVEYFLSDKGKTLSPLLDFLSKWGIDYLMENNIDYIKDQHLYK